ncbi:MAG TPA: AsmA-like C-terminal region-containing protein, partial [Tepidisphaeraceae bacterium]|nr:AsmA-like C-terminal region-containing protein [Tepidisphaeraceae bacterium]
HPLTHTDLTITSDDSELTPAPWNLPFKRARGEVHIDAKKIELRHVTANLTGGDVKLTGTIDLPKPHTYTLDADVQKVNVAEFAAVVPQLAKEKGKLRGDLYGKATIKGSGRAQDKSPLDLLTAEGELEIHQGDLWQGNVVSGIVDHVKVSHESLSTSEAAAVFTIRDRQIQLKSAAINSPLLGLQGTGVISFDRAIDLDVVAAPLGDWKMNLKKLKIPIISDVTGEIAGAVQKLLTAATSTLLYQFHVTGTTQEPKVVPIPTPILTESAAAIFGKMTKEQKEHDLIESIREKKKEGG